MYFPSQFFQIKRFFESHSQIFSDLKNVLSVYQFKLFKNVQQLIKRENKIMKSIIGKLHVKKMVGNIKTI